MADSSQNKRLPTEYFIGGIVALIAYLIFVLWVCHTVYLEKGFALSLLVGLSIAIPFKMFAAPKILMFLKSKKI